MGCYGGGLWVDSCYSVRNTVEDFGGFVKGVFAGGMTGPMTMGRVGNPPLYGASHNNGKSISNGI
jgi:hypothetical protein